jgi:hypothetical protein
VVHLFKEKLYSSVCELLTNWQTSVLQGWLTVVPICAVELKPALDTSNAAAEEPHPDYLNDI